MSLLEEPGNEVDSQHEVTAQAKQSCQLSQVSWGNLRVATPLGHHLHVRWPRLLNLNLIKVNATYHKCSTAVKRSAHAPACKQASQGVLGRQEKIGFFRAPVEKFPFVYLWLYLVVLCFVTVFLSLGFTNWYRFSS